MLYRNLVGRRKTRTVRKLSLTRTADGVRCVGHQSSNFLLPPLKGVCTMSEESCARVSSGVACRVLKSLLLASALVFAFAPTRAGRAGSPARPGVVAAAAAQTMDDGDAGVIAFEAGGEIYVTDAYGGGTPRREIGRA